MGRTARYVEIHFQDVFHAVADFIVAAEKSAGDGAAAAGDHECRIRHGVEGLFQGEKHIFADRSGDEDAIRMPGRCHHLDPESAHIPCQRVQHVEVQFACRAAAGGDLTDLQGLSAQRLDHVIGLKFVFVRGAGCRTHKTLPGERCRVMITRQLDLSGGAGVFALPAEDTFSHIQHHAAFAFEDRSGGADLCAGGAIFFRTALHFRQSGKTVRESGGGIGERTGPMTL